MTQMPEPDSAYYRERAKDLADLAEKADAPDVKHALLDAEKAFLVRAKELHAAEASSSDGELARLAQARSEPANDKLRDAGRLRLSWSDLDHSQRRTMLSLDDRYGSIPGTLSERQASDAVVLARFGLIDIAERRLTEAGRRLMDNEVVDAD